MKLYYNRRSNGKERIYLWRERLKQLYSKTDDENLVIVHYKDDATAGMELKKEL